MELQLEILREVSQTKTRFCVLPLSLGVDTDATAPSFYLWGFIDGSDLRPDPQRDVFVLCVPAIQIPKMLVSCLPPEVEEAICNCVVLKHDVVNMPVFLFDKVQASGHPPLAPFGLPIANAFPRDSRLPGTRATPPGPIPPEQGQAKLAAPSRSPLLPPAPLPCPVSRTRHRLERGEALSTPSTPLAWHLH